MLLGITNFGWDCWLQTEKQNTNNIQINVSYSYIIFRCSERSVKCGNNKKNKENLTTLWGVRGVWLPWLDVCFSVSPTSDEIVGCKQKTEINFRNWSFLIFMFYFYWMLLIVSAMQSSLSMRKNMNGFIWKLALAQYFAVRICSTMYFNLTLIFFVCLFYG